jgi:hypothetical protein
VLRRSVRSTKQPSRYVNSITSIPTFITHVLIVTDHPMGEHISTLTERISTLTERISTLTEHISTLTELYSGFKTCKAAPQPRPLQTEVTKELRQIPQLKLPMATAGYCWSCATCDAYNHACLLTPWSRVLLEKLTGSAASQEIPRVFEPVLTYSMEQSPS